jgi:hypothetical protein
MASVFKYSFSSWSIWFDKLVMALTPSFHIFFASWIGDFVENIFPSKIFVALSTFNLEIEMNEYIASI